MKKIALLLACTTILAGCMTPPENGLELPPNTTCTDLFWHTSGNGINPTELSDLQECQLAVWKPDETSGKVGDIFWVKIDDIYYSTSFSLLRRHFGNNKERAMEAFQKKIILEKYGKT